MYHESVDVQCDVLKIPWNRAHPFSHLKPFIRSTPVTRASKVFPFERLNMDISGLSMNCWMSNCFPATSDKMLIYTWKLQLKCLLLIIDLSENKQIKYVGWCTVFNKVFSRGDVDGRIVELVVSVHPIGTSIHRSSWWLEGEIAYLGESDVTCDYKAITRWIFAKHIRYQLYVGESDVTCDYKARWIFAKHIRYQLYVGESDVTWLTWQECLESEIIQYFEWLPSCHAAKFRLHWKFLSLCLICSDPSPCSYDLIRISSCRSSSVVRMSTSSRGR